MKLINFHSQKSIGFLQLHRPQKRNALNKELIGQIIDFLKETPEDPDFNVLVISGSNNFFCAGADLEWMWQGSRQSEAHNLEDANLFNHLYKTLFHYPKPLIVQVEGGAFGGALGFLACADLVTADENAVFSFSETALGLVPATVAPWIVSKTGLATAKELMLTGKRFDAQKASRINLVNYLSSKENLSAETLKIAEKIAEKSPMATKQTKNLLNRIGNSIVHIDEDLLHKCSTIIAQARLSEDGLEGINAYFEKRLPKWKNRNDNQTHP